MATLADIASEAGVSEATVSRVLNSKPGVSETTRQSVVIALDLLGYERPPHLRTRSAGLIGLVVPELDNPIFPAFAQVIEGCLARRRYTPVLCTQSPGGISEDEYVESLLDHGVSGIVFVSGKHADRAADHSRYTTLIERAMPVVFINGYVAGLDAPFFSTDDRAAMLIAVSHLRQLGHERIGLAVGPSRFSPSQNKRDGFIDALCSELKMSPAQARDWVAEGLFTVEGGAATTRALIERGATAVVCGSDLMAMGAIRAARDAGLVVPDDLSVVGFDDSRMLPFLDPPLTTLRQPVAEIGAQAVDTICAAIAGETLPSHDYLFRPELIVRSSTGHVPG